MKRGFTLIEMMVSIGIFAIITGIVMFNHGKFNSSIVVTNLSYEIALAVRQAQVYGLAVKQDPTETESVEYAYGVYFSELRPKEFYIFADSDENQQFNPDTDPCNGDPESECQEAIEIRGDVEIRTIETWTGGGSGNYDEVGELTILFLRPNPVAIIRDGGNSGATDSGRQKAKIELHSDRADKSKEIIIELSGQVSVQDPD